MTALRRDGDDLLLSCKVQPRSKENAISAVRNDEVVVRLKAPPVDGKANEALLRFIAEAFAVSPGSIRIERGEHSRRKVLRIRDALTTPDALRCFGIDADA